MSLWVKICGNTSLEDALLATEAGADALGFVFAHSPRRVTVEQVAAITAHLPGAVEKIGVFVDAGLDEILAAVRVAGLTGVQVQSDASPELPALLHEHLGMELRILRVVHFGVEAAQQAAAVAADPHVDAVLVDSRTATAVGGTGVAYDWAIARKTLFLNSNFLNSNFLDSNIKDSNFKASNAQVRLIAAGGLNPENVAEAIASLRPWGVDVVSGVEATPGRKDPVKVREFVARVRSVERQLSNRPAEEN